MGIETGLSFVKKTGLQKNPETRLGDRFSFSETRWFNTLTWDYSSNMSSAGTTLDEQSYS
jgi:hypothetical protein